MDAIFSAFSQVSLMCPAAGPAAGRQTCAGVRVGGIVSDLACIGLTILVFAVLYLILTGVERFER